MSELKDFQKRMISERDELSDKIEKLASFLNGDQVETVTDISSYTDKPFEYYAELLIQIKAMNDYMTALNDQIALWK